MQKKHKLLLVYCILLVYYYSEKRATSRIWKVFSPIWEKKWWRSEHAHARPGSAPIGGGKEGEFRDWTKVGLILKPRYKLYEDTNG